MVMFNMRNTHYVIACILCKYPKELLKWTSYMMNMFSHSLYLIIITRRGSIPFDFSRKDFHI